MEVPGHCRGARWWGTYAWANAGDNGNGSARHGAEMGDDGEETGSGGHEPLYEDTEGVNMAGNCLISGDLVIE